MFYKLRANPHLMKDIFNPTGEWIYPEGRELGMIVNLFSTYSINTDSIKSILCYVNENTPIFLTSI